MQFSLAHSCVSNCKTTADHTLQYSPTANLQGDRMQPAARGSGDDLEAGTIEVECPATPASVSVDSPRLTELHQTSAVEGVPSTIEPVRRCKVQPRSGRGETEKNRRVYNKWTSTEEHIFYSTLRTVAGQKPEKCLAEISKRLVSRDYCQVRHYYYRLLKRLNNVLGENHKLDSKNNLQVHQSMLKFWEMNGNNGSYLVGIHRTSGEKHPSSIELQKGSIDVNNKTQCAQAHATKRKADDFGTMTSWEPFGAKRMLIKRSKMVQQGRIDAYLAKTNWHKMSIELEHNANKSSVAKDSTNLEQNVSTELIEIDENYSGNWQIGHLDMQNMKEYLVRGRPVPFDDKVAPKLALRLIPLNKNIERAMQDSGHNPFLQVTLSSTKTVAALLRHLSKKWENALPTHTNAALSLHPTTSGSYTCQGREWGKVFCDPKAKVLDVYSLLQYPTPFELFYKWDVVSPNDEPQNDLKQSKASFEYSTSQAQSDNVLNRVLSQDCVEKDTKCSKMRGAKVSQARRPRGLLNLLEPGTLSKPSLQEETVRVNKHEYKENATALLLPQTKGKACEEGVAQKFEQEVPSSKAILAISDEFDEAKVSNTQNKDMNPLLFGAEVDKPSYDCAKLPIRLVQNATDQPDPARILSHSLLNFLEGTATRGPHGQANLRNIDHPCFNLNGASSSQAVSLQGLHDLSAMLPFVSIDRCGDVLIKTKECPCWENPLHGDTSIFDLHFGPTNFSQLFSNVDMPKPLSFVDIDGNIGNATANNPPTKVAKAAIDALLGQDVFKPNLDVDQIIVGESNIGADCTNRALDDNLEKLTTSFESLLGVGQTPFLMQPPQTDKNTFAKNERPFAALFDD